MNVQLCLLLFIAAMIGIAVGCATQSAKYGMTHDSSAQHSPQQPAHTRPLATGDKTAGESRALPPAPAAGLPAEYEEVWVIAKADTPRADDDEIPGVGTLATIVDKQLVPMPLQHTNVDAHIFAHIATVHVTQQFANPFDGKIEAVYVFPLPDNAAVTDFVMTVGKRRIRGIIRERKEAERIYKTARSQGYVASLLTQERPNVFTQEVANIEPGKRINIDITYFHTLRYDDDGYRFVFPMVVGPRYNPPGSSGGIGAVERGDHGASGQRDEVHYLTPSERTAHDINLKVTLADLPADARLRSVNHRVAIVRGGDGTTVQLTGGDTVPNKDFVLHIEAAAPTVRSSLLAVRDGDRGYFTLVLTPPSNIQHLEHHPLEMIFVIDASGSMNGKPIAQAIDAIDYALGELGPDDTFQIIQFSNDAATLGPRPLPATRDNVARARRHLRNIESGGGTEMIKGIRAALDIPEDPRRFRIVTFLTDGYIGNEADILSEIDRRLGSARIFSFGVGASTNRYLLNRMAKFGRGAVAYLSLNDSGRHVMARFYERVSRPAMTDLRIAIDGDVDVYPRQLPDLFAGRPIVISGRFDPRRMPDDATVTVTGNVAGKAVTLRTPLRIADTASHKGLPSVWARMAIADAYDRYLLTRDARLADDVKQLALQHRLLSAYTAFVAVDATRRTAGDHGTTIDQPVPVPDGVQYDTAVRDDR